MEIPSGQDHDSCHDHAQMLPCRFCELENEPGWALMDHEREELHKLSRVSITPGTVTMKHYPKLRGPTVVANESVMTFDVDETLVLWRDASPDDDTVSVPCPHSDGNPLVVLVKHRPHIKLLKNHAARGTAIIVWSAGGYEWARAVVLALGLEDCVHFIMSKPRAYVDDLPAAEILGERIYLKPDSPWGNK